VVIGQHDRLVDRARGALAVLDVAVTVNTSRPAVEVSIG
jgi:hypothetical protein